MYVSPSCYKVQRFFKYFVTGQCKTQTADCRPGSKMQTESKM